MDKQNKLFIVAGILLILISFTGTKEKSVETIKGNWDISGQVRQQGMEQYLAETADFDYSNPIIQQLAKNIKASTETPYEAVKMTLKQMYSTTQYSSDISVSYCYEETASSALSSGIGDCVSMTRTNVALLRAMGIPARSVGGCLKSSQRCTPLFAAYPLIEAQVTPMSLQDFKKRGFLHEWYEFWTPSTGWMIGEATSGQVFPTTCGAYIKYGYDTNQYDRCVITSSEFWELCKES